MPVVAGALSVLALTVLPGAAAAKETKLKCEGTGVCSFIVNGGVTRLSIAGGDTLNCGSLSGSGEVTGLNAERESSTGAVRLLFHGCKEQVTIFHFACSNTATAGDITTNLMTSHGVALPGTTTEAGALLTNAGITFSCAGGFASTQITGSVLGESEGKCNTETGSTHKGVFSATSDGVQALTTYTGSIFRLEAKKDHTGSGAYANFATESTATLTFNQNVILTCA